MLICLAFVGFSPVAKKRVVFFGDSITQAGVQPGGYITKLDSMLRRGASATEYELIGAGIGGNKVYDLYLRLDDDVLSKSPNAVVIWVGVNDVWHKRSHGTGTDPDKFEKFYNALIKKIKGKGAAVYVCTPAVIGERNDYTNELDGDLNRYSAIIRGIAKTNDCPLIDLREAFALHLRNNNPQNKDRGILTTDGVHLNDEGNLLVAKKMKEALEKIGQ